MASKARSVWAIDIGNNSLKALNLGYSEDAVEVLGFETIEYENILSSEDVSEEQQDQVISASLEKLAMKYDLRNEDVAISVAGQTSFARFIKLPPVEPKKVPQIIQFEAVQQIPFDINEVEWDYQLMDEPDSPDVSVGIFAIKNEIVGSVLDTYSRENIRVSNVQMSPMALYNAIHFDSDGFADAPQKAVIALDMGTDNTNIVICTSNSVWQRSIPMGGNDFTEAIAEAFKLNFKKAEKLKRTAPVSKYARQIFQAMKPVFTNLSEEIQRSLGYFSSTNNVEVSKIVALGGSFKLQGLTKYLQQSIGVPVVRPDSFKKLKIGENVSSAKFHENVADFGIVYGLGIQALGLAKIQSNLLPRKIARAMTWQQKSNFLTLAASILLLVSLLCVARAFMDKAAYGSNESLRRKIKSTAKNAQTAIENLSEQQDLEEPLNDEIEECFDLFKYRNTVPLLMESIAYCLPNADNNKEQSALYQAFKDGDVEAVLAMPRQERKQLFVTSCTVKFSDSLEAATFAELDEKSSKSASSRGGSRGSSRSRRSRDYDYDEMEDSEGQQDGPGFLVLIEGYSPYRDIGDLLDPAGVDDDKTKWGFITRLLNLKDVFGKADFELYKKDSIDHFSFDTDEVVLGMKDMPAGIGKKVTVTRVEIEGDSKRLDKKQTDNLVVMEDVLIDPMTGEELSKTFKLDEFGGKVFDSFGDEEYIIRDHWFRIKAKFLWKDAPESESMDY